MASTDAPDAPHRLRVKMTVCGTLPWPICPDDTLRVSPDFKSGYEKFNVLVLDHGQFSLASAKVEAGLDPSGLDDQVRWRKCGTLNTETSALLKGVDVVSVKATTAGDGFVVPLVLDYDYAAKPSSGLVQSTLDHALATWP